MESGGRNYRQEVIRQQANQTEIDNPELVENIEPQQLETEGKSEP